MPRRRAFIGLVVTLALVPCAPAGARATRPTSAATSPSAGVRIYRNGSIVRAAYRNLGVPSVFTPLTVCGTTGPPSSAFSITLRGWSLPQVLAAALVTPQQTSSVTITQDTSGATRTTTLLPADFDPDVGSDYFQPDAVAVIGQQDSDFTFFRPVRSGPCLDANPTLTGTALYPLDVNITTGPRVLEVSAAARPSRAPAGSAVRLSSAVVGVRPGVSFSTTWSFDDGTTTASGADVTHVFSRVGTYAATASVVGSDGSGGVSPPVTITVGSAPGTPGNGATETTHPPQGVATDGPASGVVVPGATARSGAGAATAGASAGASLSSGTPGRVTTATPRGGPAVVSGLLLAGDGVRPGTRAQLLAAGPHGTATATFHLTTGESVGGLTAALLLGGGVVELRLGGDGAAAVRRTRRSRTWKGRHTP